MANWTKATLASRVLEFIKVKAVGQSTDAAYTSLVQDVIDSEHALLKARGLAPFLTSSIPDWAKWPLVKIIAEEVAPIFGKQGFQGSKSRGKKELSSYISDSQTPYPTRPRFY